MPLAQRDVNASRPSAPRTPPTAKSTSTTTSIPSRLPRFRRAATPNSAASHPRQTPRMLRRAISTETAMGEGRGLQQRQDSTAAMSYHSDVTTPMHSTSSRTDKPLPARPVARLSSQESPPSESRQLIDASEVPMQIPSPSGRIYDWATLTPTPAPLYPSTPTTGPVGLFEKGDDSPREQKPPTPATSFSVVAAAAELTRVITTERRTPAGSSSAANRAQSSQSAYESANESSFTDFEAVSAALPYSTHTNRKFPTPDSWKEPASFAQRTGSQRKRLSSGSLIPQAAGSTRKFTTLTDSSRDNAYSPAHFDSRPHSPSPASFSCLRPGSGSFRPLTGDAEAIKTASRLPIFDNKKPTVVDVTRRTSQTSSKSSKQPATFGNRHLDSRTADILDNGIKRRQLQRNRTHEDAEIPTLIRAPTDMSDAPTLDTSSVSVGRRSISRDTAGSIYHAALKSEEELTHAPSISEDESEITTPVDRPMRFSKRFDYAATPATTTLRDQFGAYSDYEANVARQAPPPTSPFTGPLETIPSQATLPVRSSDGEVKIKQALSHLEGKGNPPKHDVDGKTLMEMFGHMKKAFESLDQRTTESFLENAAMAEKYLELPEERLLPPRSQRTPSESIPAWARTEQLEQEVFGGLQPAVSKWSNTTPSEKENSEGDIRTPNISTSQELPREPLPPLRPLPPPPPPTTYAKSYASIGYPSRVAATPETLTSSVQNVAADGPDIAPRRSSPTLGPKPPSSIRTGRTRAGPPGFARSTRAAEARRNSHLPTPRADAVSEQRGRPSAATRQVSNRESETPRARSKSRYVMDKLNGLFNGKRDKTSVAVPPVPRISEAVTPPNTSMAFSVDLDGVPMHAEYQTPPPVPRLNTPRQPGAGLRSTESNMTLRTDEGTLVDDPSAPAFLPDTTEAISRSATRLMARAKRERNARKRDYLLEVVLALTSTSTNAREARAEAERAQLAACAAQTANEIIQATLKMMQSLAVDIETARAIRF